MTKLLILPIALLSLLSAHSTSYAAESVYLGVAIVQQLGDTQEMEIPIIAEDGNLMADVGKNGRLLVLGNSASLSSASVISIANNVLFMKDGSLKDRGSSCQFVINITPEDLGVGGKCELFTLDSKGKGRSASFAIPMTWLDEEGQWMMVYYDDITGAGVYVQKKSTLR